ncbi:MAG: hypothetical protein HYR96_11655 [Deltaproteobacteria bacterium]|nr:hypothetical protein [Deltaproteobacteria bacterium]MBI3294957.1 hypothetical protein [Deltaproteobacteria bacterium]
MGHAFFIALVVTLLAPAAPTANSVRETCIDLLLNGIPEVEAPEFDPKANGDWAGDRALRCLRIIKRAGLLLDRRIVGSNHPVVLDAIHRVLKKRRPGSSLMSAVEVKHGNGRYPEGLRQLGYNPEEEILPKTLPRWRKAVVPEAILALAEARRPLAPVQMREDDSSESRSPSRLDLCSNL